MKLTNFSETPDIVLTTRSERKASPSPLTTEMFPKSRAKACDKGKAKADSRFVEFGLGIPAAETLR